MKAIQEFTKGIIKENPVFVMALGLCPTLAVSTSVQNAIGMGAAATFVLVFSNIFISLIKNLIPSQVRIPCFILVIASFVTIVDMAMEAYVPPLHKSLGIFIPLIVVNCIILGRAEAFASKNGVFKSMLDGLGMGFGFMLAIMVIALIREFLGVGTILDIRILPASYKPMIAAILPPGAFVTIGLLMGLLNILQNKKKSKA
ncbi:MAG: electron transport complex subunit E [Candidatus Celaenobacter antarcticus]|nr:electron transport complex subunit E [Candidatus Celaenobacter antarcticus]MDP8315259.1 electron transport complex subunit E [Candidatus Celaenobacter antarcticus]